MIIFTPHFFPGYKAGGVLRSVENLVNQLHNKHNIKVITSDRDLGDNTPYSKNDKELQFNGKCSVMYVSSYFCILRSLLLISLSKHSSSKDCLLVNGFFNLKFSLIPLFFSLAFLKNKFDVYLFPRGELGEGAIKNKYFFKKNYLRFLSFLGVLEKVNLVFTDGKEVSELKMLLPNVKFKYQILPDLPNLSLSPIKNGLNLPDHDAVKFVFVGRVSRIKNIHYMIELINSIECHNVILDIYGEIEDKEYYHECLDLLKSSPDNVAVNFLGAVEYRYIPEKISSYHFLVLLSLSENFSHVIAESLFLGVPVLISDKTPWTDLVRDNELGYVIELNDVTINMNDIIVALIDGTQKIERDVLSLRAKECVYTHFKFIEKVDGVFNEYSK
ncbi:glycosyltransferase family 4 protein [Vibrio navarrensis]|uniref:glycosyltransferase family 4 protein n=1 Tax=Vibrio navarrensis TaxID=29495 RepID=UPI0013020D40|nr:glycosyltransferase [Vibrio navarrensis]